MPGENAIDKKEVKANKEPDMKMKSHYTDKTLQLEGREAGKRPSFVGLGLGTRTAVLSQSILNVIGEFG